jgi:hypothetical protein
VERATDWGQWPLVRAWRLRSSASKWSPKVPASTSTVSDGLSTERMPVRPQRSRTTPPCSGTDEPTTPLRPPAAVTGIRASLQMARTAPTWAGVSGRTTAPATAATWLSAAQVMARGHQSRLASARSRASVVTDGPAPRSRSITSSGTSTALAARWPVTADGSPARVIGAVGAPGPGAGSSCGVAMGQAPISASSAVSGRSAAVRSVAICSR